MDSDAVFDSFVVRSSWVGGAISLRLGFYTMLIHFGKEVVHFIHVCPLFQYRLASLFFRSMIARSLNW